MIIVLILIISGLFVYNTYDHAPRSGSNDSQSGLAQIVIPANTPADLPNIPHYCDQVNSSAACNYHWHIHLDIFVNSSSYVVIPNELGHINNQEYDLYAIHTHDYSGIVHIECCSPPEDAHFTLGDIFVVWGYPAFDSSDCLVFHGQQVRVYVNGTETGTTALSSIPLSNHDEIVVTIGVSHPNIPSSYDFPPGF